MHGGLTKNRRVSHSLRTAKHLSCLTLLLGVTWAGLAWAKVLDVVRVPDHLVRQIEASQGKFAPLARAAVEYLHLSQEHPFVGTSQQHHIIGCVAGLLFRLPALQVDEPLQVKGVDEAAKWVSPRHLDFAKATERHLVEPERLLGWMRQKPPAEQASEGLAAIVKTALLIDEVFYPAIGGAFSVDDRELDPLIQPLIQAFARSFSRLSIRDPVIAEVIELGQDDAEHWAGCRRLLKIRSDARVIR